MQSPAQLVTRARGLAQAGPYDEARTAYRQAIAAMPRNAELLLELGVLAGRHGDFAGARRTLEKALKLDHDDANIHYNLGQVAKQEGQNERAAQFFRRTLQLDPSYHDALVDLGDCLYRSGQSDEALAWLDKAVEAMPEDVVAHHVRGMVLDKLGRRDAAAIAYRRALRIDPHHLRSSLNLAVIEAEAGSPWEALELIDKVEAAGALPPEAWALAARVLHLAGEPQRASAYVEHCLQSDVNANEARMTGITIAMDAGDFAAAEADLRQVVDKDPAWASYRLAVMRRLEPEAAANLRRLAGDVSKPTTARIWANFALYNLLDQAGDHDRAFAALQQANSLKARSAPADTRQHARLLERIAEAFSPEFLAERASWGYDKAGPVYVVGMPRSGTSLTEQILAAHPRILGGGEREEVERLCRRTPGWPADLTSLPKAEFARMGGELYERMTARLGDATFVTDKTPGNYVHLGMIRCVLPQAKLVYVRRHPGDNLLSLYEQNFLRGLDYSYNLDDIVEVYRAHVTLMNHWISTCRLPVHTVDYDALVADPEPHVRALLDYVGVDFHPDCLKPEQVVRTVHTASVWQVRQPITAASTGRWKRYERQLASHVRAMEEKPCSE